MRLEFSKVDSARFLSHLDIARIVERAVRRAGLPVAYTKGYNPHPKISFGPALPVGAAGEREYFDIEFLFFLDPSEVCRAIDAKLPPGIEINQGIQLPEKSAALNAVINSAGYRVWASVDAAVSKEGLNSFIERFLEQKPVVVERRTKKKVKNVDIQPAILQLQGELLNGFIETKMLIMINSPVSAKPMEVFNSLIEFVGLPAETQGAMVTREGLFVRKGEKFHAPLDAGCC